MSDRKTRTAVLPKRPANALVASADIVRPLLSNTRLTNESWQNDAWRFYEIMGEFTHGVTWFSEGMSRIRLTAAQIMPGGDEPKIVKDGPVADLVESLAGGIGGHAALMRAFGVQFSIPGEAFLVGTQETDAQGVKQPAKWNVYAKDELRVAAVRSDRTHTGQRLQRWEIQVDDAKWELLSEDTLVIRIWQPDPRKHYKSISSAKAALPIMQRLERLDLRTDAMTMSRLASNGILLYPKEITFQLPPEFSEEVDPLAAMLVDVASKAIAQPGLPAGFVPIPIGVPAEHIENFKHMQFANEFDDREEERKEAYLKRLATALRMPAEILTGVGNLNHWGAWQLEEEAIKLYFSPTAELICSGLTQGFLHPSLRSMGLPVADGEGEYILWYDTSELTVRPDRSQDAKDAYDRGEISPTAFRRETGFSESDKPTADELKMMALKKLVFSGGMATDATGALEELTGVKLENKTPPPVIAPVAGGPQQQSTGADNVAGPPASGPPENTAQRPAQAVR